MITYKVAKLMLEHDSAEFMILLGWFTLLADGAIIEMIYDLLMKLVDKL
jgi:hypothetical protein